MYTKKVWKTGDTITADAMNNIEKQVEESSELYDVSYSDTLEWDGDTTGLEYFSIDTAKYYLISQDINSPELFDDRYSIFVSDYDHTTEEDATSILPIINISDNVYMMGEAGLFTTEDNCMVEVADNEFVTIPKKGLYMRIFETLYVSKIVFPGKNVIKNIEIKSKYIHKTYTKYNLSFDNNYLYRYGTDTTNVENRVTKKELSNALENGHILIEIIDGTTQMTISPISVVITDNYGTVNAFIDDLSIAVFYTAEYTPSS